MQKAALVIRTCGDMEIASTVAKTFESPELKRLRAQAAVSAPSRHRQYEKMIREARRKYRTKPMSPLRQRFWGAVGLAVLLAQGH